MKLWKFGRFINLLVCLGLFGVLITLIIPTTRASIVDLLGQGEYNREVGEVFDTLFGSLNRGSISIYLKNSLWFLALILLLQVTFFSAGKVLNHDITAPIHLVAKRGVGRLTKISKAPYVAISLISLFTVGGFFQLLSLSTLQDSILIERQRRGLKTSLESLNEEPIIANNHYDERFDSNEVNETYNYDDAPVRDLPVSNTDRKFESEKSRIEERIRQVEAKIEQAEENNHLFEKLRKLEDRLEDLHRSRR